MRLRTAVSAALAVGALAPASSLAAARTIELRAGETKTWNGAQATGLNFNYWGLGVDAWAAPGTCDTEMRTYCDTTLLAFHNPVPADDADGRISKGITVTLGDYLPPDPATDFDLIAFRSDSDGTRGTELGHDGDFTDTHAETISFSLVTTRAEPTAYAIIDVVYWAAVNATYAGSVRG